MTNRANRIKVAVLGGPRSGKSAVREHDKCGACVPRRFFSWPSTAPGQRGVCNGNVAEFAGPALTTGVHDCLASRQILPCVAGSLATEAWRTSEKIRAIGTNMDALRWAR
ncbi:hypothetical protein MRX96_032689 [Rhipicephalus microplus]